VLGRWCAANYFVTLVRFAAERIICQKSAMMGTTAKFKEGDGGKGMGKEFLRVVLEKVPVLVLTPASDVPLFRWMKSEWHRCGDIGFSVRSVRSPSRRGSRRHCPRFSDSL
jgi:hypothetical protein